MARKKVTLAWISDDATRRATLKKRRKGIIKKTSELSTLCGVEACAIVYGPHELQPEVWPSESKVKETLARFKSMSEMDQSKKRVDQQGFLNQQIMKLKEQIRKQQRDNWELQMMMVMNQAIEGRCSLREARVEEAAVLGRLIEERLEAVKAAADGLRQKRLLMEVGETSTSKANPNPNANPSDDGQVKQLGFEMMSYNGGGLEDVMMGAAAGGCSSSPYVNNGGSCWMDAPFDHFPIDL